MSDVTKILSGRIQVKRQTAYVLDGLTPSFASSFDRQPLKTSRLEVNLSGVNIAAIGTIIVYGGGSSAVNYRVFQDRSLATKWALTLVGGIPFWSSTSDPALAEPVVQDTVTSLAWKIYFDNGIIGWESVVSTSDDSVVLYDSTTMLSEKLAVSDGILGFITQSEITETFLFTANGTKVGIVDFINLASVSVAGIVGGSMMVRTVNSMGQPMNQIREIYGTLPVRFFTQNGRIKMEKAGQDKISRHKIMAEPDANLADNDLIYVLSGMSGLTFGKLDIVEKFYDFDGVTHHTEAALLDL